MTKILNLTAWSFTMVISSFIFLYIGRYIDEILKTEPNFMLGLFFLAIFLCIGKLYNEAWKKRNQ